MSSFHKTFAMLALILRRDWLKLVAWLIGLLLFAAAGAGKFEVAMTSPAAKATMYTTFQSPAFISMFGPTSVKHAADFTIGALMGQSMVLFTVLIFAVVAINFTVNRTRKDEDDGLAELLGSFQVGRLSNTTALVIISFIFQILASFVLTFSLQAQGITSLGNFSSNLLFAASVTSQSLLWGLLALVFAQIFSNAASAKAASYTVLSLAYIIRMAIDLKAEKWSWLNPLSWSYLTEVYVHNNWLPILLTCLLSVVLLVLALFLQSKRDLAGAYLVEHQGRARASKSLLSIEGLVFRQQRNAIMGWLFFFLVFGLIYGSIFSNVADFAKNNQLMAQMLAITGGSIEAQIDHFMVTIFRIMSVITVFFVITVLSRMLSEERKNRQEQLYATALSRYHLFAVYVLLALIVGALAQFFSILGIYLAQMNSDYHLEFLTVFKAGMVYLPAIYFVLGLLALLIAFVPRLSFIIWAYAAFSFFMGYLGNILDLPKVLRKLDIFYFIPQLPVEKMNSPHLTLILVLSAIMLIFAFIAYRKRDLITG